MELSSRRLVLEPLRVEHAREMVAVVGGYEGLDEAGLRERFARQVAGRERGWLNWVVRMDGVAVGTVQASVTGSAAELAWVVAPPVRGRGIGGEAALAVVEWLRGQGVTRLCAHIAPSNGASAGVARRLGLEPTDFVRVDGEVRWELA